MVIQRLQTLYLLIATVLMVVFAFCPSVIIQPGGPEYAIGVLNTGVAGATHPDLLMTTVGALTVLLSLITIFKFKNLKLQMKLCSINAALTVTLLLISVILALTLRGKAGVGSVNFTLYNALPVLAVIMQILAYRGIKHDKKLLSSSERLR